MAERKTLYLTSAVFAAGLAAGAGAERIAVPVLDTAAKPLALRLSPDGYGVDVHVKAGAAEAMRILNYDRNGGAPLLDSQPIDDDDARAIGQCAATFAACAEQHVAAMADALAQPAKRAEQPGDEAK